MALHRPAIRTTRGYEEFARALVSAVRSEDPTRPVVENDWIEADPADVFDGDVLTAHWYGRLQRGYLADLEAKAISESGHDRPLLVSEFGDWGLPDPMETEATEFWEHDRVLAKEISATTWGGTVEEFLSATQRYQGLADRLQGEVFRWQDHIAGYRLTKSTDVPQEFENGVLDFHRRPKQPALGQVRRMNQAVLPMARLDSFAVRAGHRCRVRLSVVNDGPRLADVVLETSVGGLEGPVVLQLPKLPT